MGILFGANAYSKPLRDLKGHTCKRCEAVRPHKLFQENKYSHVAELIKWDKQVQYFQVCDVCKTGERLDAEKYAPIAKKSVANRRMIYMYVLLFALLIFWRVYLHYAK